MVLMVTDCLAISTSTSKISPSELCSFIVGMIFKHTNTSRKLTLTADTDGTCMSGWLAITNVADS